MAPSGEHQSHTVMNDFDQGLGEKTRGEKTSKHKMAATQGTWELEKDLARQSLDQYPSEEKDYERAAMAQISVSRKRADKSNPGVVSLVCAWLVEHQIGISVNLLLLLAMTHLSFPRSRHFTRKFFSMSYYDPWTGKYGTGWDDLYFIALWTVIVTGARVAIMQYLLEPLAALGGIRRKRVKVRYAEQGWLALYYFASWMLGMYIMYQQPYFFNLREMWTDFPVSRIDGTMKWYYLVQFGFWVQQILVVNIEERRKDYAQMFTHHIFTCALLFFSYGYYQTRVGNVILSLMDVVDILLSIAKCLKYQGFQLACDLMFGAFMVSWLIARHGFYLMVCWSIWKHVPEVMKWGCWETSTGEQLTSDYTQYSFGDGVLTNTMKGWNGPDGVVCLHPGMRWIFLWMLLGLQVITIVWFTMIMRVAYKVLSGKGADEVRSEDEGEDDSEDEEVPPPKSAASAARSSPPALTQKGSYGAKSLPYLEEEVTADKLYVARRTSSSSQSRRTSRGGRTSALHIPGHSDPKDILNRIGCETKTTDE